RQQIHTDRWHGRADPAALLHRRLRLHDHRRGALRGLGLPVARPAPALGAQGHRRDQARGHRSRRGRDLPQHVRRLGHRELGGAVKKELPLLIGFLAGAFALAEFYIPANEARLVQKMLLEWASVLAAAAFVLGGINVIQVNVPIISRRRPDWPYKLVLIVGAVVMLVAGIRWDTFGAQPEPAEIAIAP